jgi:hypothetical protein
MPEFLFEDVDIGQRNIQNEEANYEKLHNLYSSPNIIKVARCRREADIIY